MNLIILKKYSKETITNFNGPHNYLIKCCLENYCDEAENWVYEIE